MKNLVLWILTCCIASCLPFSFKANGSEFYEFSLDLERDIKKMIDGNNERKEHDNKEKMPPENKEPNRAAFPGGMESNQRRSTYNLDGILQESRSRQKMIKKTVNSGRVEAIWNSNSVRHRRSISTEHFPASSTPLTPNNKFSTLMASEKIPSTTAMVMNFSATARPFLPKCLAPLSCRGRCQGRNHSLLEAKEEKEFACNCDDECEIFQDCCADLDMFCATPNTSLSRLAYSHWHCHSDIWMIDKCPKNWTNKNVGTKCVAKNSSITWDNYGDVIPVVSRSGKTYRNRFYAQCHGDNREDMEYYGLHFNCDISPPQGYSSGEAMKFLFEYCTNIKWQPRKGQHKRNCIKSKKVCRLATDYSEFSKCTKSPARLVVDVRKEQGNYKNAYCAKCSTTSEDVLKFLECGPGISSIILKPTKPPAPFSIIMDIGRKSENRVRNQVVQVNCFENEVYDILLELCRPVSQVSPTITSSQFNKHRIAMWIKSVAPLSIYGNSVVQDFLSNSLGMNCILHNLQWQELKYPSIEILVFEIKLTERIQRLQERLNNEQLSVESLLNFTRPLRFIFQNHTFIIIKATARQLTCVGVEFFTPEHYVVMESSSSIYINHTREILTEKQYFANSTESNDRYRIPVGTIAVCRQYLPRNSTCNGMHITLDEDEYVMLPNNSVYRNASNTVYNKGEYTIINGSVVVCTNYSNTYTKRRRIVEAPNDRALLILTYVGLSLSVVCLVFVLVTYLLFEELRTLPGINLMNLSTALLVAHFFWLVGSGQTGSHGACVAIAAILHYSFLASFAWMSVIAFNTWKSFSSTVRLGRSTDKEYTRKKIGRTVAVGWLPVLVLVVACLTLDQSGAVQINYGGPKGCWINNGRANLFIFVLPTSTSVAWNGVFFGLTVKAIRQVREQTRMVKQERHKNSVYMKIAVLMGFTWIFGLLALFVSPYFMHPFVAFNTIQGAYIAVCFAFTRRVKNLYVAWISKSKIHKKRRKTNNKHKDIYC